MLATAETHHVPQLLIADDDPAIVKLLADRCRKMGFSVETAVNGMQMLIKARHSRPDVVIVDVGMPALDGISASARLLETCHKPINVIVVTGRLSPAVAVRCESMGMYYSHKGPNLWKDVEAVLMNIHPGMADGVPQSDGTPVADVVPQRPRVLVVDDDPAIGTFLASRLGKHGIDTICAANAIEAYRIACRERPSVIISDYDMPDGDARYLLARLRSSPATENIPVIVLSGKKIDDQTEQLLRREIMGRAGAAQILKKQFDVQELFTALETFCAFERLEVRT